MFIDIVKQLSSELKILVITHDDKLKEKFDDIIMVEKDSGGSRVVN
jgi:DNA repair exonuclease SbcCD ATPase subunit